MIIAVDGPAASGKGTIARALARRFGLPHLDTGLLYRAVGLAVLNEGGDPAHEIDALRACSFSDAMLDDPAIRSEAASRSASIVSAHPAVRAALMERQRAFAAVFIRRGMPPTSNMSLATSSNATPAMPTAQWPPCARLTMLSCSIPATSI